jgi:hypothetical protein
MGLLDFLKTPRSDNPNRKASLEGRSQLYNLLDNIIGFEDDRFTPGEALGAGLRQDPMGVLGGVAQGVEGDLRNLMFEGGAMQRPADVLGYAAAPMAPGARGLLSRSPDVVYSNPVMQPFDMGGSYGHNGGPRLDTRVPYTRSGEDIQAQISGIPSAKSVMGVEDLHPGSGFTGIGSLKPRALSEHQSTGYLSDEIVPPQIQRSIAPLLDRDVMAIVGDPTGRHTVTGVAGEMLPEAVDSKAGFQYIDVPGQGYAGAKGATSSKANEAMKSQDPYYTSLMMGEESGDFSRHQGNIFGQMFRNAPIASKDIPKIDEAIRKIGLPKTIPVRDASGNIVRKADGNPKTKSITTYPFSEFGTVADPNAVNDFINAMPSGTQRAYFLKGMDRATLQKMGVPRVSDARIAAADPAQIGMDWGTVGYRGFTPDLERGLYPTTSVESTTYDTGIGKIGEADTFLEGSRGIPANLLYRDKAEAMREKGTGGGLLMTPADYKGYESSPKKAKQRIDNMAVETVDTFLEMERRHGREAALRYAGELLSGGRITSDLIKAAKKANAPTWIIAAMAPSVGLLGAMGSEEDQY